MVFCRRIYWIRFYIIMGLFLLITSSYVNSENCEFNGWVIPNLSPENTIFMDGSWWSVEEFDIENQGVMRSVQRLDVEPPENGELLPIEQAMVIATQFLQDNRDSLGIPESVEIVVEQTTNYPLSLTLFNFDQQYCNGVPVENSFAGVLMVGQMGVYSLGFVWYPSFNIPSTSPGISSGQASSTSQDSESNPELKILPQKEGDFKLIWDVNGTYVDALNGDVLNKDVDKLNEEAKEKSFQKNKNIYKWIILIFIIIIILCLGLFLIKR